MNQNRVTAGLPTGGQFATGQRAEADDVTLEANAVQPPSPLEGLHRITALVDEIQDRIICDDILGDIDDPGMWDDPQAPGFERVAYLSMEEGNDDQGETALIVTAHDESGDEIDDLYLSTRPLFSRNGAPDAFTPDFEKTGSTTPRPEGLPQGTPWRAPMIVDVAKLRAHDFAQDWNETQLKLMRESMASLRARGQVAAHAYVDRAAVEEQIGFETDEELSDEEQTEITDRVMKEFDSEAATNAFFDTFHTQVDSSIRQTLSQRLH